MADVQKVWQVVEVVEVSMGQTKNGAPVLHIKDHAGRELSRFANDPAQREAELSFFQKCALEHTHLRLEVGDPTGRYPKIYSMLPAQDEPLTDVGPVKQGAGGGGQRGGGGGGGKSPEEAHSILMQNTLTNANTTVAMVLNLYAKALPPGLFSGDIRKDVRTIRAAVVETQNVYYRIGARLLPETASSKAVLAQGKESNGEQISMEEAAAAFDGDYE